MKTRCVELSQFESELLIALCRTIYRRLEGPPAFAQSRVNVYEKSGGAVRAAMAQK